MSRAGRDVHASIVIVVRLINGGISPADEDVPCDLRVARAGPQHDLAGGNESNDPEVIRAILRGEVHICSPPPTTPTTPTPHLVGVELEVALARDAQPDS